MLILLLGFVIYLFRGERVKRASLHARLTAACWNCRRKAKWQASGVKATYNYTVKKEKRRVMS